MNANPAVYRENLCFQDRKIHHKSFVTECVTKKPIYFKVWWGIICRAMQYANSYVYTYMPIYIM